MRVSTLMLSAFVGWAAAAPFTLSDGFPSPSAAQLKAIEYLAGGTLPNGALPKQLTAGATVTFQLIGLNEIFEVFYFNTLLSKIKSNAPGFTFASASERQYAIDTFTAIANQEELHAIGVNAILSAANEPTVAACNFAFPPTTYAAAVELANTFTDVVLSVLPVAQLSFAQDANDEVPFVKLVGSIIAQEGEQNGWFRSQQGKVPSAAPFLTGSYPTFAFSFLKTVIEGECQAVDMISKLVPSYSLITVVSAPTATDQTGTFSVVGKIDETKNSIVFLSGQNAPVSRPIFACSYDEKTHTTTFRAHVYYVTDGFSRGLTVAAVVNSRSKPYADDAAVAANTLYGPGIIEIN